MGRGAGRSANITTAGKIDERSYPREFCSTVKADLEGVPAKLGGTGPRTLKALIEWNQPRRRRDAAVRSRAVHRRERRALLTTPAYRKARDACVRLSARRASTRR
jgi:hypothetical protein